MRAQIGRWSRVVFNDLSSSGGAVDTLVDYQLWCMREHVHLGFVCVCVGCVCVGVHLPRITPSSFGLLHHPNLMSHRLPMPSNTTPIPPV
jgi:hypothetical protein